MLVLDGPSALSPFRLERLNARLHTISAGTRVRQAWYVFVLDTDAEPDAATLARLREVLEARDTTPAVASLWVTPRLGTVSPWSSKASDILRGCGFAAARVERGVAYALDALPAAAHPAHAAALDVLHDRMTESVLTRIEDAAGLFLHGQPGALEHIALAGGAQAALQAANARLGLALATDEIGYLVDSYRTLGRDPTDAELMMFAQANSEHCRHKVFNAHWTLDGEPREETLFGMIRATHAAHPAHTLSAYNDNAAVIAGSRGRRFGVDAQSGVWRAETCEVPYAIKVETHNHPTAIAPWPGAATGAGGEIRDEGAVGRGGKPKVGLTGFSVSHLRIPGLPRPWESERPLSPRYASAFEIMRDGPLGAAAFNNEFGRPCLAGYLRSFEQETGEFGLRRGYDKPIMLAGGIANLAAGHVQKLRLQPGDAVLVLGGPALLIGLGGGAASSMHGGTASAALDYASVQRDNAEMERRCQEVIDACCALGAANPIVAIHDVGAGGLSNALPELLHDSGVGGEIELARVPSADPALSPMQLWCNEAQERYVLGVRPDQLDQLLAICARERCPVAQLGTATAAQQLRVRDSRGGAALDVADMPLPMLLGKAPRMQRDAQRIKPRVDVVPDLSGIGLEEAITRVLRHPSVGSKSFLITIGDRSVGGLCARDPMVGPWQVPVADCALSLIDFEGYAGEAMAVGERTPLALIGGAESARMAIGEALTNLAAAPIGEIGEVRLSANWMAAVDHPGEDARLFDAVAAASTLAQALDISIPVGKDSLSMQTRWDDAELGAQRTVAPVSLVVSAFARVTDVRRALTPQLRLDQGDSDLWLLDLGAGRDRLGESILVQVFNRGGGLAPDVDDPATLRALFAFVQQANAQGLLLAYHDRSDGGLIVTLLEMAFAGHCGFTVQLDGWGEATLRALFNEELGAVLQARRADRERLQALALSHGLDKVLHRIGEPREKLGIKLFLGSETVARGNWTQWLSAWQETSHAMQRLRDNPASADAERAWRIDDVDPGLSPKLGFEPGADIAAPFIASGARPRVAILREQGVNGEVEMAAAFTRAGFEAVDVHMSDLQSGRRTLADFTGFAACGGFSYGDVLGAGRGWAASIRYNAALREQFQSFIADPDHFVLGVCNGCQMLSELKTLIPGAEAWPHFRRNTSEQYEARLVTLEVMDSPSIFLAGMAGSRIPVVVAHGEGRAMWPDGEKPRGACLRYVDNRGKPTESYPLNPNGSPAGLTGFHAADGRVLALMPHPERVFRSVQMSWRPERWTEDSPWLRLFRNARVWLG